MVDLVAGVRAIGEDDVHGVAERAEQFSQRRLLSLVRNTPTIKGSVWPTTSPLTSMPVEAQTKACVSPLPSSMKTW